MNISILKSIDKHPDAVDFEITIAIGDSAKSTKWETISISWAQLVTALRETRATSETFQEYKKFSKSEQAKCKDVGAFLGGGLSGPRRLKTAVTGRSVLTIDLDGPNGKGMSFSLGELIELYQERFNYEAAFYTTHSHHKDAPRVRLIIPLAQELDPRQYEPAARAIAAELGLNEVDPASFSVAQCMFLPSSSKDGEFRFYHNQGKLLDPADLLNTYEDWADQSEWPRADRETKKAAKEPPRALDWNDTIYSETRVNETGMIPHSAAIRAVRKWEERERGNLEDYQHFVAAMMIIAKSVQLNEISTETGRECVALLAGDREDWRQGNMEKFEKELDNQDIRTDKTFRMKFMYEPGDTIAPEVESSAAPVIRRWDTATSLYTADLPAIEFYIEQILPVGVGWLAGAPKVGKSFLAIQMAQAISSGLPFLGYQTTKTPVIYYSLEMAENLMQSRLRLMFCAHDLSENLHIAYSLPQLNNGGFQVLEDDIKQHNAGAVFIDVHGLISTEKSSQKPMYEQTYKEMAGFRAIAERTNCSIVLITHLNKNSVGDDFDRIMGSTANRGATDFNIILARREARNPMVKEVAFKEECRKAEGVDLILEQEKGIFKNLGTIQDIMGMRKHEDYLTDPVVNAIKCTVAHQDHAKVTAAQLLDIMPEWARAEITPLKIGHRIKSLMSTIQVNDNILIAKGKDESGRYYEITRPEKEWTLTPILNGFKIPDEENI